MRPQLVELGPRGIKYLFTARRVFCVEHSSQPVRSGIKGIHCVVKPTLITIGGWDVFFCHWYSESVGLPLPRAITICHQGPATLSEEGVDILDFIQQGLAGAIPLGPDPSTAPHRRNAVPGKVQVPGTLRERPPGSPLG